MKRQRTPPASLTKLAATIYASHPEILEIIALVNAGGMIHTGTGELPGQKGNWLLVRLPPSSERQSQIAAIPRLEVGSSKFEVGSSKKGRKPTAWTHTYDCEECGDTYWSGAPTGTEVCRQGHALRVRVEAAYSPEDNNT